MADVRVGGLDAPKLFAPDEIRLKWCPVCGRHDRWVPFAGSGRHGFAGKRCLGQPVEIPYRRAG